MERERHKTPRHLDKPWRLFWFTPAQWVVLGACAWLVWQGAQRLPGPWWWGALGVGFLVSPLLAWVVGAEQLERVLTLAPRVGWHRLTTRRVRYPKGGGR